MKKLLLGLIGGVSLGMLFAPEKGSQLRKKLVNSDEKLKDFGKELLSAGKGASDEVKKFIESEEVQVFFEKGKTNISDLVGQGKDLSTKGKKELKDLVETVKTKAEGVNKDELIEDIKGFFSKITSSKESSKTEIEIDKK